MLKGLVVSVIFCLVGAGGAFAKPIERIYTRDGEVIEAKVVEKTEDTIWYEAESGDIIEEIGIDISEVEKIVDSEGNTVYLDAHR